MGWTPKLEVQVTSEVQGLHFLPNWKILGTVRTSGPRPPTLKMFPLNSNLSGPGVEAQIFLDPFCRKVGQDAVASIRFFRE